MVLTAAEIHRQGAFGVRSIRLLTPMSEECGAG